MSSEKFLELLDKNAKEFLFSAFDYRRDMYPVEGITDINKLKALNDKGYCIYVTVNKMKGGRLKENVQRVRAIWVDDDNPRKKPRKKFPLPPSIIVQTSAHKVGKNVKYKYQYYWLTNTKEFDEFEHVMQTMVDEHGNDKGVKDLARVLRLPGFNHMKDKNNPHPVKIVGGSEKKYSWEAIKIAFPPAKHKKSSTKVEGKYDKKKAKSAIATGDDYHGSLRDRAMELANKLSDVDDIIAILRNDMEQVPVENRDERWEARVSEEHLFECANSAVKKYEAEGHLDEDEYTIANDTHHHEAIKGEKIKDRIISPKGTIIGELTDALYKTWWVPNRMVAGLAARSIVAYLAGGKYRSTMGDRLNIQQVAIGETGCGKDLLFNRFGDVIEQVFPENKETRNSLIRGIVEEAGSAEGIDLKLRTNGDKHDLIMLQDEIGGLIQTAKKDNRKREILEMLLKYYTKSDNSVSERALVKQLPAKAAEVLYAPHIILSGATTPKLITQGLDSTFLSYGSASRMIFFEVGAYAGDLLRTIERVKLSGKVLENLKVMAVQKDRGSRRYPGCRVSSPVEVKFDSKAIDLCFSASLESRAKKGVEAEVWNRHVANAKKYAMIEAIAEDPRKPKVTRIMMKRNLALVASACEYSCRLFSGEVGEAEHDVAKKHIIEKLKKYANVRKVVKMADINTINAMRKMEPNKRYGLLREMEEDGTIVRIEKSNPRGKPTITFILGSH